MDTVFVPDYFNDFHCKCGSCRHPCCDGWGINVDEREYFSLIGLSCGKRLREKLDDAFVPEDHPTRESFAKIRPNYLGQCPMLDGDGLCLLQKEKGEDVMPMICRLYPRALRRYGDRAEICMSCSCEETVEEIMKSDAPLTLTEEKRDLAFPGLTVYPSDPARDTVRVRAVTVMCDPSLSIADRLIRIGELVTGKTVLPDTDRAASLLTVVGWIRRLCEVSDGFREAGERATAFFDKCDGSTCRSEFDRAEAHLLAVIPHLENTVGRLVANHLIYESFPYVPGSPSSEAAFTSLCMAVAMVKVLTVAGMADDARIPDFVDIVASSGRFIEHSGFYRTAPAVSCASTALAVICGRGK